MARSTKVEPILAHPGAHATVATRVGTPIRADRFVADVLSLAARLPPAKHLLNTCHDRYAFAVTLCAGMVAQCVNLLPPSRTPETLKRIAAHYVGVVQVNDGGAEHRRIDGLPAPIPALDGNLATATWPPPLIAREQVAAIAFTSGSTGEPLPHPKSWGGIVDGARAEMAALGLVRGTDDLVLTGTVSAQHMYGLESTLLLALHGPCAFATEHPLHPDEVIDTLQRQHGHRVLVTTPVHLRALVDAGRSPPPIARVISATAPLAVELAQRCESAWNTRVMEVYGCTETGMIATRRTVDGPLWHAMRDVRVELRDEGFWASGGHVAQPGPLTDHLQLHSDTAFELLGRADDVVNIGGKRASLAGLNRILATIPGVEDGVIFRPEEKMQSTRREARLMALVVAPSMTSISVLAELRKHVDAAFLPRPLLMVESLPRNPQGKLPRAELLAIAADARRVSWDTA